MSIKITVFFEEPFWVGIFEREESKHIEVMRVVFGAEPREIEVFQFILENYGKFRFSMPLKVDSDRKETGFKRKQREIKKNMIVKGVSTKSQEALKIQMESRKNEKKEKSKLESETEKKVKFQMKQDKKREKHKGH